MEWDEMEQIDDTNEMNGMEQDGTNGWMDNAIKNLNVHF